MHNENAIKKFRDLYRQADLNEILALWENNTRQINIYVHSPFCPTACAFCYYQGQSFRPKRDHALYEHYYHDYLPQVIAPFMPIIEAGEINNYFFGGGTPSLMTPRTMSSVFKLFPGFKKVKAKTFEIHPAVWSEEQLDLLAEYGFNCCIIGIQSFNESVLKRQNRPYVSPASVYRLVEKIKERGMYVACDFIYRMDAIDAEVNFKQDLYELENIPVDVITFQHNFDDMADKANTEKFLELICHSPLSNAYYWHEKNEQSSLPNWREKAEMKGLRYVKNEIPIHLFKNEIFNFMSTIDEVSKKVGSPKRRNSVIGFGSYLNTRKNTFSNIVSSSKLIEYIEVNQHWNPEYYVVYEEDIVQSFYQHIKIKRKINAVGSVPSGVEIAERRVSVESDGTIFRNRPNQSRQWVVSWEGNHPEINAYIEKVKQVFPNATVDLLASCTRGQIFLS